MSKAKEKNIKEKQTERLLKVEFTPEERALLSLDLARYYNDLEQKRLDKKEVVKGIDAELTSLEATISKLATKVHDGYEYRGVKCKLVYNFNNNTKQLICLDNDEVVSEYPITDEERQMELPDSEEEQ